MTATSSRIMRAWIAPTLVAAGALVCPAARLFAQNTSTLTVTVQTASGSPSGIDFKAGFWVNTTLAYTVACGTGHPKCEFSINSTGTLTPPAGSISQLQYSFDGGAFTPVPSTVTLLTPSFAGTRVGSIVLRYLLGWAPNGSNPYTPPAASGSATFSLPVVLTLQQGQP